MIRRLLVIGAVPPPHHGVTISTSLVLANPALGREFRMEHVDISDRRDLSNIGRLDVMNVVLALRSAWTLAGKLRGPRGVVYLPLSQGTLAVLRDSIYIRLAAARGWRVAIHLRGGEFRTFYEGQGRLMRWWIDGTLARVASVGVMGACLRWLFEGLVPPERIAVVVNGTPDLDVDTACREQETGLFLGNLFRRKGVVEALEAALLVLRERPAARFIFAGEWESADLERQLRLRAREAGDRIEFAGIVSGSGKLDVLSRAGYLLFPPVGPEGHPRVVLEALAAGLPVIATDRGAICETVVDGESGYVLDEPVPALLADRMLTLLREPGRQERMGRAARERHHSHFRQEIADRQLAEWLCGLTVGSGHPA